MLSFFKSNKSEMKSLLLLALSACCVSLSVAQGQCQSGLEPIDCTPLAELCTAAFIRCDKHPEAECRQDSCDLCTPYFWLNNMRLNSWDCELAQPDDRCSASVTSGLRCPPNQKDACKNTNDCSAGEMCCNTGCQFLCVPEINDPPGVCPPAGSVNRGICTSNCDEDEDCRENQKCCSNGCAKLCTATITLPNQQKCPDGSDEVYCAEDPCNVRTCIQNPEAECRSNRCGGCNAEFFDKAGNRINCNVPACSQCVVNPCFDAKCQNFPAAQCRAIWCPTCEARFYVDEREVQCGGDECNGCVGDPCAGKTCPANTNAVCVPNTCDCTWRFADANGVSVDCSAFTLPPTPPCTKPDGTKGIFVRCEADPCAGTCMAYPSAQCRPNYCGECSAIYTVGGKVVNCGSCPGGGQPQMCRPNACAGKDCPAIPNAQCFANPCNSCEIEYSVNGQRIRDVDCIPLPNCPPGSPQATCAGECLGRTCPGVPGAECQINGCGGCTVTFYRNRQPLNARACGVCDDWSLPLVCAANLCAGRCLAFPDALCSVNRCGSCREEYRFNGKLVDCNKCPDGKAPSTCTVNTCQKGCPAIPTATCRVNACNNCQAEFFVAGQRIKDVDCIVQPTCPPNTPQSTCQGNCLGRTCPGVAGAECVVNGCGGCTVTFYKDRKALTAEQCGLCNDWSLPKACKDDLCDNAVCRANPMARCSVNRCKNCEVTFSVNGQAIDCNACPNGQRPFTTCTNYQCLFSTCPGVPDAECRPDDCNACRPRFYHNNRYLRTEECMRRPTTSPSARPGTCPRDDFDYGFGFAPPRICQGDQYCPPPQKCCFSVTRFTTVCKTPDPSQPFPPTQYPPPTQFPPTQFPPTFFPPTFFPPTPFPPNPFPPNPYPYPPTFFPPTVGPPTVGPPFPNPPPGGCPIQCIVDPCQFANCYLRMTHNARCFSVCCEAKWYIGQQDVTRYCQINYS